MNDANGEREDALGVFQSDELFVSHIGCVCGYGQDRNADTDLDRTFDRLDVVKLHHVVDLDLTLFEDAVNRLACGNVALEGDEVFTGQAFDAHAAAARELVFGITNDDQLVVAKPNDLEVGAPERQRDNAKINRIVETGFIDFVGAAVFDLDFDLRVGPDELFDVRRQFVQADAVNGGDLDRAGRRRRFDLHPLFQRMKMFENLPAFGVENPSGFGERHAFAPAPLDQLLVESLFERFDLLADGRLRYEIERGRF